MLYDYMFWAWKSGWKMSKILENRPGLTEEVAHEVFRQVLTQELGL